VKTRLLARLQRAGGGALALRMVVLSLLLLLVVQLAGFLVVRDGIERNARQTLDDELQIGERVWNRLVEQRAQKLTQVANLLAADYGFLSAVNDGDTETIRSALDNAGLRIRAGAAAILDPAFAPRAVSSTTDPAVLRVLPRVTAALARSGRTVEQAGTKAYQFVLVPMRGAGAAGWVLMGFELDAALLADMRAVSELEVAVLATDPVRATLATLPIEAGVFERAAGQATFEVSGTMYRARSVAIGGGLTALLMRSVDSALAPYRRLQGLLGVITGAGIVLFMLGSAATARQVTRPLQHLADASERLGRGDYGAPIGDTARRDEIGDLARTFESMRTGIALRQAEIRQLAYTDTLTQLPNRTHFREALGAAIAQVQGGATVAVIVIDLDRFKQVNDVLGHASGDRLLGAVARRLGGVVERGDLVARLGGDEFALLLHGADAEAAAAVARRIVGVFEQPVALDDQTVDLAAGIGIACWPQHAKDADTLLSRAELAVAHCKKTSEAAKLFEPSMEGRSEQSLTLLSELKRALERGELQLYLQPKVALDGRRLVGAEGLMRWQHPQRGLVPPMQFIPFAEQTGFIRRLTLWVFEEAARAWAPLQRHGALRLSVNLSARDLFDVDLPRKLEAILARQRAPASGFCLEITESAIMDDPVRTATTVAALDALGFELSIDDFGTGYSSLAYLKQLPVKELKIDRSFVIGMERDNGDAKIVRSTIDLAHNLNLRVVAEGVENEVALTRLAELGCDVAQGYHLSRPLPLKDFDTFAAAWTGGAQNVVLARNVNMRALLPETLP
jgi:diguanylate cyclase (GGDEF)-like protein